MGIFLSGGVKGLAVLFASVYGSGTYDGSTYNGQASSAASSGGTLANTGLDIAIIVTIACVIALTAVIIRVWKRPSRNSSVSN